VNFGIVPPEADFPGLDVEHATSAQLPMSKAPTADRETIAEDIFLELRSIEHPFCRQQIGW